MPEIPGIEGENVIQAWDLLEGKKGVGRKIVILGGNALGLETAIYLATIGTLPPETLHFLMTTGAESMETLNSLLNRGIKEVTVVEMTKKAGKDIGLTTRWTIMAELKRLGVTVLTETQGSWHHARRRPDRKERRSRIHHRGYRGNRSRVQIRERPCRPVAKCGPGNSSCRGCQIAAKRARSYSGRV